MSDTMYFNASANSAASALIKDWQNAVEAHRKAVSAFQEKHGIKGLCVSSGGRISGFCPGEKQNWRDFLDAMPEWRRIKARGCDYVVPRKIHKELSKEWASFVGPMSIDYLAGKLTGLMRWTDWLIGLSRYHIGLVIRKDGSAIVAIEYKITKLKDFAPVDGLVLSADQNALRDEWIERMDK